MSRLIYFLILAAVMLWLLSASAFGQTANEASVTVSTVGATTVTLSGSVPEASTASYAIAGHGCSCALPSHGTITNFNAKSGTLVYTPMAGFTGSDFFTFTVLATPLGGGNPVPSSEATIRITVTNAKTRIIDRLLHPDGSPRTGAVTFVLLQSAASPDGLAPASAAVSATLESDGQFDISVYPSRSLNPQSYYNVLWAAPNSLEREIIGVFDIPASTSAITLAPYLVTDTNLAVRYRFASAAAVEQLVQLSRVVQVLNNGTLVGRQPAINFISGSNVSLTTSDNGAQINVTINASAGGSSFPSLTDHGAGVKVAGNVTATTTIQPGVMPYSALPAAGTPGRLVVVNDGSRGVWLDTGSNWASLTGEVYYGQMFGMKCDGTTDDSSALQAAINAAGQANGGVIDLPPGTCRINSQLTFINDGATPPRQKALVMRGAGGFFDGAWLGAPNGGTILDLRYAGDGAAKFDVRGGGVLKLTHLTLMDGGSSAIPFIQTTNTTLLIDGVAFVGSGSGATASTNDAIVLGSTTTNLDGSPTAAFQGYGTVIQNSYFSKVRRAVFAQTYANAVVIKNNTISTNSGFSTGAAIDIEGASGGGSGANAVVVRDNLIEVSNYKYGIRLNHTVRSTIAANSCFDSTSTTTACVRLEANASYNLIQQGFYEAGKGLSDAASNSNTILNADQSDPTIFHAPVKFINDDVRFQTASSMGPKIYSAVAPASYWYEHIAGASGTVKSVYAVISGGSAEEVAEFQRASSVDKRFYLAGSANNVVFAAADLRVLAASGATLFLGSMADQSINIAGGVLASTKTTGTAPFSVLSTTKVNNLNVDQVDDAHASATPTASSIPIADGSGLLSNGWINWAAPSAIGSGTPAAGTFTTLAATNLSLTHALTAANGGVAAIDTADQGFWVPSLGSGNFALSPGAAAAVGAKDEVRAKQVTLTSRLVTGRITVEVTTAAVGAVCDVGLYDAAGTKKVISTAGRINGASATVQTISLEPTTLLPAVYWWAWTCSESAVQMRVISNNSTWDALLFNSQTNKKVGIANNPALSGVLPSSLGGIGAGASVSTPIGVFER